MSIRNMALLSIRLTVAHVDDASRHPCIPQGTEPLLTQTLGLGGSKSRTPSISGLLDSDFVDDGTLRWIYLLDVPSFCVRWLSLLTEGLLAGLRGAAAELAGQPCLAKAKGRRRPTSRKTKGVLIVVARDPQYIAWFHQSL